MQWLSGLYYADFISFYSPTQLCGGGTTKSNSNELPISVPLSFCVLVNRRGGLFFQLLSLTPCVLRAVASKARLFFSLEKCGHLNQDAGDRLPFFPSLKAGVDELLGQAF